MPYGLGTRAIMAPIGIIGRNRYGRPRRYVPLSQFFLQGGDDDPDNGQKPVYGLKEPEKKKKARDKAAKAAEPQEAAGAPEGLLAEGKRKWRKCRYCDQPAVKVALCQPAGIPTCADHLARAKKEVGKVGDGPVRTMPLGEDGGKPFAPEESQVSLEVGVPWETTGSPHGTEAHKDVSSLRKKADEADAWVVQGVSRGEHAGDAAQALRTRRGVPQEGEYQGLYERARRSRSDVEGVLRFLRDHRGGGSTSHRLPRPEDGGVGVQGMSSEGVPPTDESITVTKSGLSGPGITGSGNVPAVAVPIGAPQGGWAAIDSPDKKKKRKKKLIAISHLLRRFA